MPNETKPYVEKLKELLPEIKGLKFRYERGRFAFPSYDWNDDIIYMPSQIKSSYTNDNNDLLLFETELCFRGLYGFGIELATYYLILHEIGHYIQKQQQSSFYKNWDSEKEEDENLARACVERKISYTEAHIRHLMLPSERDASDFAEKFLKEHRDLWEKS
jgi:hypothetical protein